MQYTTMAPTTEEVVPAEIQGTESGGNVYQRAQQASREAASQVANLMRRGLQQHEAEEMVLPDLITLPPEKLSPRAQALNPSVPSSAFERRALSKALPMRLLGNLSDRIRQRPAIVDGDAD